jgi:hypothetical protein
LHVHIAFVYDIFWLCMLGINQVFPNRVRWSINSSGCGRGCACECPLELGLWDSRGIGIGILRWWWKGKEKTDVDECALG